MPSIMRNNIRYGSSIGGGNEDIVELTQEKYDELGDSVLTDNKTYYITDADDQYNASSVIFDNTDTNLNAVTVQEAIVEQNKKITANKEGTFHTITSEFVCPSDGYVICESVATGVDAGRLKDSDGNNLFFIIPKNRFFARAGMIISPENNPALYFVELK